MDLNSFQVSTDDGIDLFSRLKASQRDAAKVALPSAQGILDRILNRAKLAVGATDDENKPFCG